MLHCCDSGLSGGQEQDKTLKLLQEHHELNTELQSNPTVKAIQSGKYKHVSRIVTRKGLKATGFYGLITSVLSVLKRNFMALGRLLYRWKRTLIAVLLLCFYFYCTVTNYKNIYTMLQELPGNFSSFSKEFSLGGFREMMGTLVQDLRSQSLGGAAKVIAVNVYKRLLEMIQQLGSLLYNDADPTVAPIARYSYMWFFCLTVG